MHPLKRSLNRHRWCLRKGERNGGRHDRYYLSLGTHDLSNAVSSFVMYVMNGGKRGETERVRESRRGGVSSL